MRTHYCGQIDINHINSEVKLCGWVHRIRDLGELIFIDLRDRTGIVQIVIRSEQRELMDLAKSLHNEWVIYVAGQVKNRPDGLVNEDIKSGAIEIIATQLEALNPAQTLPFSINEQAEASEELRLTYRYLDLRRPKMLENLMLRSQITKTIRNFLDKKDFIEVETPILTKSTPEGARDYLVPSRVHSGCFYALPQSPQIFKQLLMVAGIDRYYQIARCFRDEDLRADRQPEFTQLDMEMSFIEPSDIKSLTEDLIRNLFDEVLSVKLPNPFPSISYQEAMTKYGSDKPDLRVPLELVEIKDLMKDSTFNTFAAAANDNDSRVVALRVPQGEQLSRSKCDGYEKFVINFGLKGLSYLKITDRNLGLDGIKSTLTKFLSETTVGSIFERTLAHNGDMIFFAAGKAETVNNAMGALRIKIGKDLGLFEDSWRFLWVVDFPMFEKKDGKWTSIHHPFTAPQNDDPKKLESDPGQAIAKAYDLVLNGFELGGGSIRISNASLQQAAFRILSLDEETAQNQFGHLLKAFQYGCPPHGGIALGLDRLAMLMAKADSIREVIAFPKTLAAYCPLTGAPSKVNWAQLAELKISTEEKT